MVLAIASFHWTLQLTRMLDDLPLMINILVQHSRGFTANAMYSVKRDYHPITDVQQIATACLGDSPFMSDPQYPWLYPQ